MQSSYEESMLSETSGEDLNIAFCEENSYESIKN